MFCKHGTLPLLLRPIGLESELLSSSQLHDVSQGRKKRSKTILPADQMVASPAENFLLFPLWLMLVQCEDQSNPPGVATSKMP